MNLKFAVSKDCYLKQFAPNKKHRQFKCSKTEVCQIPAQFTGIPNG